MELPNKSLNDKLISSISQYFQDNQNNQEELGFDKISKGSINLVGALSV